MGRKKTGNLETTKSGRRYLRITVKTADGKSVRKRVPITDDRSDDEAKATAARLSAKAEKREFTPVTKPSIVFSEFAELWLATRTHMPAHRKDVERLRSHITPFFGKMPMDEIGDDEVTEFVELVDRKVSDEAVRFGGKLAKHVWYLLRKLMEDATRSKHKHLKVLARNPCENVSPPYFGKPPDKQWLYPNEFARLMLCEAVPSRWRRIYAVATILFMRSGEAKALKWADVDLQHGTVRIYEQIDEKGQRRDTKGMDLRIFPIEPVLLPLLRAMRAEEPEAECVLGDFDSDKAPGYLREHCKRAGIERAALYERTNRSRPLWFHDLRATGLTWLAIRGDSILAIQQRAGHTDSKQTDMYIRRKDQIVPELIGRPFPALPASLLEVPRVHGERAARAATPAVASQLAIYIGHAKNPPQLSIQNRSVIQVRRGGLETPREGPLEASNESFQALSGASKTPKNLVRPQSWPIARPILEPSIYALTLAGAGFEADDATEFVGELEAIIHHKRGAGNG